MKRIPGDRLARIGVSLLVLLWIASTMYSCGERNQRSFIANPDAIENSFGGLLAAIFGAFSLLLLGGAALLASHRPGVLRRTVARVLALSVVAMWSGYGIGVVSANIAGPAFTMYGAAQVSFQPLISEPLTFPVVCTSVVGDSNVIASVQLPGNQPFNGGLNIRYVDRRDGRLAIRPGDSGAPDWRIRGIDASVLEAYEYTRVSFDEDGRTGVTVLRGERRAGHTGPPFLLVEERWSCGSQ